MSLIFQEVLSVLHFFKLNLSFVLGFFFEEDQH